MDVLNEYFGTFGSVVNLQINHSRHEAIITYSKVEEAEQALKWPVLNDGNIGLRPWRAKAGQRGPHEVPAGSEVPTFEPAAASSRKSICNLPAAGARKAPDAPADGAPSPPTGPAAPNSGPLPAMQMAASGGGTGGGSANMVLSSDSSKVTAANQQRQAVQEKRMTLLASLTGQLKMVMARINDPKTNDKAREQFQGILATIREKMNALTPKEEKPPPAPVPAAPPAGKAHEEPFGRAPGRPPHMRGPPAKVQRTGGWNRLGAGGAHRPKPPAEDGGDSETEAFDSDVEEDELEKLKAEVEATAKEAEATAKEAAEVEAAETAAAAGETNGASATTDGAAEDGKEGKADEAPAAAAGDAAAAAAPATDATAAPAADGAAMEDGAEAKPAEAEKPAADATAAEAPAAPAAAVAEAPAREKTEEKAADGGEPAAAPQEDAPAEDAAAKATTPAPTSEDLNSKTVVQLKELLKDKGLSQTGKKAELIERLQAKAA